MSTADGRPSILVALVGESYRLKDGGGVGLPEAVPTQVSAFHSQARSIKAIEARLAVTCSVSIDTLSTAYDRDTVAVFTLHQLCDKVRCNPLQLVLRLREGGASPALHGRDLL